MYAVINRMLTNTKPINILPEWKQAVSVRYILLGKRIKKIFKNF